MNDSCPTCATCKILVESLDKRIDQRIILEIKRLEGSMEEKTSRLEERYVNQKEYNKQHNDLQREMKEQAKETVSASAFQEWKEKNFEEWKERVTKLERWPWMVGGALAILQAVIALLLKFG